MALPCCPPFAQGGLRCSHAGQQNQGQLCPLGKDCTLAPTGVGSPAPEHRSKQRIQPSANFGCPDTGPGAQYGSSVTLAPPGARKRSGKNLVFPRKPGAASPTVLMVISALCRNNTPPAAKNRPYGNQVPIGPVFLLGFGSVAQRGSAVWPSGHRTSLVQRELSANAD